MCNKWRNWTQGRCRTGEIMTTNWDKTKPASTEFVSNFPQEAQNNWGALEDALGRQHVFPGTQGGTAGTSQATTSTPGHLAVATAAECQTGTDNTKAVTPLGLTAGVSTAGNTAFGKLKVHSNAGTPASKVDILAHSAVLIGSTENYRAMNVSVTVDATVTGANGLDAGSLGTNWYYFYIIAKADGTVAGLCSLSATTPGLPTDYLYALLVSAIYYDTTAFRKVNQYGTRVNYTGVALSMFTAAYSGWTSVDISAFVPPNALTVIAQPYSGTNGQFFAVAWNNVPTNICVFVAYDTANFEGVVCSLSPFPYVLNPAAPQTLFVESLSGGSHGGFYLKGYELDI